MTTGFALLTPKASAQWDDAVRSAGTDDVHFSAAYARVQETLGGEALLAVRRIGPHVAVKPVLVRDIPGSGMTDVTSLYGYGGQIGSGDIARFLDEDLARRKAVSEFTVLHPKALVPDGAVEVKRTVVWRVDRDDEPLLVGVRSNRRPGIVTGRGHGERIETVASGWFDALYAATMDRLEARRRWRFDHAYFAAFDREMEATSRVIGWRRGGQASAVHVMWGGEVGYLNSLGSNADRAERLDDAAYFEAARFLRGKGVRWFNLGGGRSNAPDDSLLAYKAAFSEGRSLVRVVTRILDREAYATLSAAAGDPKTDFFPAYRAEEAQAA